MAPVLDLAWKSGLRNPDAPWQQVSFLISLLLLRLAFGPRREWDRLIHLYNKSNRTSMLDGFIALREAKPLRTLMMSMSYRAWHPVHPIIPITSRRQSCTYPAPKL